MKERTLLYTKLAIAFFLICWVGIVYDYVTESNVRIKFTQYEHYGAEYHRSVLRLVDALQQKRSLEVLSRVAGKSYKTELDNNRDNILNYMFLLRGVHEKSGRLLQAEERWDAIRDNLIEVTRITEKDSTEKVIYDLSHVIQKLIELVQHTADTSNLILDPKLSTYYLMDLNVKVIPHLSEHLSRMLIKSMLLITESKGEITEQEKLELFILQGSVNRLSEQFLYNYSVLEGIAEGEGQYKRFDDRKSVINLIQPRFLSSYYQIIADSNQEFAVSNVFRQGIDLNKHYIRVYNINSDELMAELNARVDYLMLRRDILMVFAIAVFAAIIFFYCVFKANLARRAEIESQIIRAKETLEVEVQERTSELRQQKSLFESIIDHIPLAIFAKDVKDNYSWLFVNKRGGDLFCVDTESIVGFRDYDIFVKEQADLIHKIEEKAVRNNEIVEVDDEVITTLKGNFRAHIVNVPIYDANGSPDIVLGILEDITEKRKAGEKMRMLEASVEHSEDTVIITDTQMDGGGPYIIYVNPTIKAISGYSQEELIGKPLSILYGAQNSEDRRINILRNNLREGRSYHGEIANYTKEGSEYWVFINIFPVPNEQGQIINYAAIQRDITRERAMRDELIRSKRMAEQANETKTDFLANMSHELRTPLNSILGMTRMLKEGEISDNQRELVNTVFQSSVSLLEIVNDILDLSKIEAGEVQLEQIGFDISYVLKSTGQLMSQLAKEKKLEFIENHNLGDMPYVVGDPTRITRILNNLVGNAIKYTLNGQVRVESSYEAIGEKKIRWRCEVIDTGIGIPANKLEHIFDKFTQADISTTRKFGGTGLGLTITKELIELMDGVIEVESKVGKGSIFRILIPFETTDTLVGKRDKRNLDAMRAGEAPVSKARILVAEDHPMNKLLAEKLLEKLGIDNFDIVENGVDAIEMLGREHYDVILMDCHMPEKNGYDATIDIRKKEKETGEHVPIVAMTANAMVGDRDKCIRVGMDDYISKPIDIDELKDVLSQWIIFDDKKEEEVESEDVVEIEEDDDKEFTIDLTMLETFTGGDAAIRKEFIDLYLAQSEENIVSLRDNCVDGYNEEWSETAHQLKGGSANIGATKLVEYAAAAQEMIEGTHAEREELFSKIEMRFNLVKTYLLKVIEEGLPEDKA